MNTTSATMNRVPTRSGIAWKVTLILIPLITLGLLLWLRQLEVNALRQRTISSYGTVPSFQLVNQNGQPFGSGQLAGKICIADFIYTTCPGPFPMISSRMSELQKPLEKTDVHLVSFSVDPDKDTPEVLRRYAERLQAEPGRWDFLTGPKSAIYKLSHDGFKLAVSDGSDAKRLQDQPTGSGPALGPSSQTIRRYWPYSFFGNRSMILARSDWVMKPMRSATSSKHAIFKPCRCSMVAM